MAAQERWGIAAQEGERDGFPGGLRRMAAQEGEIDGFPGGLKGMAAQEGDEGWLPRKG